MVMEIYNVDENNLVEYSADDKSNLDANGYEKLLTDRGQECIRSKAYLCTCRQTSDVARIDCPYCHGLGVRYIGDTKDVIMAQSMTSSRGSSELGMKYPGRALGTVSTRHHYNYRDRITLTNSAIMESMIFNVTDKDATHGISLRYSVIRFEGAILASPTADDVTELDHTSLNWDPEKSILYPTEDMIGKNLSVNLLVRARYYITDFIRQNRANVNGDTRDPSQNVALNHKALPVQFVMVREDMVIPSLRLNNDGKVTETKVTDIKASDQQSTTIVNNNLDDFFP